MIKKFPARYKKISCELFCEKFPGSGAAGHFPALGASLNPILT